MSAPTEVLLGSNLLANLKSVYIMFEPRCFVDVTVPNQQSRVKWFPKKKKVQRLQEPSATSVVGWLEVLVNRVLSGCFVPTEVPVHQNQCSAPAPYSSCSRTIGELVSHCSPRRYGDSAIGCD